MDEISSAAARPGWVYFVGAGPGDPDLLTLRGAALLAAADVVFHDAGTEELLLRARPDARLSPACAGDLQAGVDEIVTEARAGRSVVRLVGGDPLLFGVGTSLALALAAAGISFEVVPGISVAQAASAYAGIPLGQMGGVTILGDAATDRDWKTLRSRRETLGVHLDLVGLGPLCRGLMIDGGWSADTPAAVVQRPSLPRQRCVEASLGGIVEAAAEAALDGEALLLVGEAVALRESLRWFDSQPLFGQRVLVTRPAHQAAPTLAALRRRGALGVPFPTIAIEPPPDPARVSQAVAELDRYDLVAFTSDNGVSWFWREIERQGRDARAFGKAKVAAIGPATAAGLKGRGIHPEIVAETFVAEHLAEAIVEAMGSARGRVLLPRALVAREILPELLREAGFEVDVVPVYRTVGAGTERRDELGRLLEEIDLVMLTSSSTVEHLVAILGEQAAAKLAGCKLASIGPITSTSAEKMGLSVWVSAEVSTAGGLIDAMEQRLLDER